MHEREIDNVTLKSAYIIRACISLKPLLIFLPVSSQRSLLFDFLLAVAPHRVLPSLTALASTDEGEKNNKQGIFALKATK